MSFFGMPRLDHTISLSCRCGAKLRMSSPFATVLVQAQQEFQREHQRCPYAKEPTDAC